MSVFCRWHRLGAKAKGCPAWRRRVSFLGLLAPWALASTLAAPGPTRALELVESVTLALTGSQAYTFSVAPDPDCILQGAFADSAPPASRLSGLPFEFPHPTPFSSPGSLGYGLFLGGIPEDSQTLLLSHSRPGVENLSLALYGFDSADCQTSLTQLAAGAVQRELNTALEVRTLMGELGPRRVEGLALDGRFYFYDPSRRSVFSSGRMAPTAALETLLFRQIFTEARAPRFLRADLAVTTSTFSVSDAIMRSAVDAQANLAMVYDLMLQMGLNGYDGRGGGVFVLVGYRPPTSGCSSPVALSVGNVLLFSPSGTYRLPRNPPLLCSEASYDNSYVSLLDVFAHEYAHVVTRSHINLRYRGESGALDEAFADWTGVVVELAAGGGLDWQIAEGLRGGPAVSPAGLAVSPLRDLQAPNRLGDPARIGDSHWRDPNESQCNARNDYCYVHSNSGVPNHMFYRLATGLAETETIVFDSRGPGGRKADLTLAPFDGLGVTPAFSLGLYAATNLWQREETFAQAADHMRVAARMVYGADSCEVEVVARSWAYVGVPLAAEEVAAAGERLSCKTLTPDNRTRRLRSFFLGVWGPKSLEWLLWLFFVFLASRLTAASCMYNVTVRHEVLGVEQ